MLGLLLVFLVATVIRLYFDLIEVYTVQLGLQTGAVLNARPDRRVRLTLRPAWRTLTRRFAPAWITFLLLTLLGFAVLALCTRFAVESLAQPRVWPAFAVVQLGVLFSFFTRFWQRGAETVLAQDNPLPFAPAFVARPVVAARTAPLPPAAVPHAPVVAPPPPIQTVVASAPLTADPDLRDTPPPPEVL